MISKPPRTEIDERLSELVDRELAARLISQHPRLYSDVSGSDSAPSLRDEWAEPSAQTSLSRRGARLGDVVIALVVVAALIASVVAPVVLHRLRALQQLPTTHRLAIPQRHVKHARSIQSRIVPLRQPATTSTQVAASQAFAIHARSQVQLTPAPRVTTVRHRHAAVPLNVPLRPGVKPQVMTRTAVAPAQATRTAPLSEAAAATNVSSNSAGSLDGSSRDPNYPGRQIPSGPVWTDNGPPGLSATPGGLVLGGTVAVPHPSCSPSRGGFIGSF